MSRPGHEHHDHDGHDHGHGHGAGGHAHGPARHDRAFAIGIAINVAFVVVEAAAGWRIDSLALLADAGHNLGDVLGLVLAWAGAFAGRLAPDERHTWGWKRGSILAAFGNALLLLVAMGSLVWAAVLRLQHPGADPGRRRHGGGGDRHRRQPLHRAALPARPARRPQHPRRLPAHDRRRRGLGRRGRRRRAGAVAGVAVGRPGGQPADRRRHPGRHLAAVPRFAAPHVRRRAELDRPRRGAQPSSRRCPGSTASTTCTSGPAARPRSCSPPTSSCPAGHPDDAFFRAAAARMQERFAIGHVTLQASTEPLMPACGGPNGAPICGARARPQRLALTDR